jgi:hypothetical protein
MAVLLVLSFRIGVYGNYCLIFGVDGVGATFVLDETRGGFLAWIVDVIAIVSVCKTTDFPICADVF